MNGAHDDPPHPLCQFFALATAAGDVRCNRLSRRCARLCQRQATLQAFHLCSQGDEVFPLRLHCSVNLLIPRRPALAEHESVQRGA